DISAMMIALANLSKYQAMHGTGGGALTNGQLQLIGDLTGDSKITNADLQGLIDYLANGRGSGGGSLAAVPEPASVVLLLVSFPTMVIVASGSQISSRRRIPPA